MSIAALLLIDIQNDFLADGALGVPYADEIIHIANALMLHFPLRIATRDWHPSDHISFAGRHQKKVGDTLSLSYGTQMLWPDHCVQKTQGAQFPKTLNRDHIDKVFHKGEKKDVDSYSVFFDAEGKEASGIASFLKEKDVDLLYVMGLATDYCVFSTICDAIKLGFFVCLIRDACRAVDPETEKKALDRMAELGVSFTDSCELLP